MSQSPAFLDADTPNPFALGMASANPTVFRRFWRGLKTIVLTLLVTAVLLGTVYLGKHWLLARLVSGFENLDPAAKQTRLIQIASFGHPAIEALVDRLLDGDDSVSESAFVLLQKMQNDWVTLGRAASLTPHRTLVDAINQTYLQQTVSEPGVPNLTDQQIARGRELLNQTILEFADFNQQESGSGIAAETSELLGSANELLNQLNKSYSGSRRSKIVSSPRTRLQDRAGWTDWPPQPKQPSTPKIVRSNPSPNAHPVETSHRLNVVPPGQTVPLTQIVSADRKPKVLAAELVASPQPSPQPSPQQTSTDKRGVSPGTDSVLQVTTHLTSSPLAVLDDETVIRHLANPDEILAREAHLELKQRGFTPAQLEMAKSIAVAGPEDRIRLIDSLVHSSQFDSGPWLSMLLEDPDRKVRMHVVSTLAAGLANDRNPALWELLRRRLDQEKDWHVAWRIRKSLERR